MSFIMYISYVERGELMSERRKKQKQTCVCVNACFCQNTAVGDQIKVDSVFFSRTLIRPTLLLELLLLFNNYFFKFVITTWMKSNTSIGDMIGRVSVAWLIALPQRIDELCPCQSTFAVSLRAIRFGRPQRHRRSTSSSPPSQNGKCLNLSTPFIEARSSTTASLFNPVSL